MTLRDFMHQCEDEYVRKLLQKHAFKVREAAIEADCHRAHLYRVMKRSNLRQQNSRRGNRGNEAWQALTALERAT